MDGRRPARILHIIQRLTDGGAARSMLNEARLSQATGLTLHRVVSLLPAQPSFARRLAAEAIDVLDAPDAASLRQAIDTSDGVVIQFWNTPELYAFLRAPMPPARVLLRPQIGGLYPPQVITPALLDYADMTLLAAAPGWRLPVVERLPDAQRRAIDWLPSVADFSHLSGLQPRPHSTFNIGYIGTLSPIKLHPRALAMSAAIRIPDARFILCGAEAEFKPLRRQAERLGLAERLDYRGYVKNTVSVLAELDVLGYPLAAGNYSAADLALQEAMAAGVPPVIFPHGATSALVTHNETGLIVHTEQEYVEAIDYLYHQPEKRRRLGAAAADYARQRLGPDQALATLQRVYAALLQRPKRARQLTDVPPGATGADRFVAALGDTAPHFAVSLRATGPADALAADQAIAASPLVVLSEGGGGLFHYRAAYPRDPALRLWSGLALMGQGQNARALIEFRTALELDWRDGRAAWGLAQVADRLGATALARQALDATLAQAPDFAPARRLLDAWDAKRPS